MSNDGGSAFPSHGSMGEVVQEGMSLLDYLAAAALQGLLSARRDGEPGLWFEAPADKGRTPPDNRAFLPASNADLWAAASYRIAAAMLKAGEQ